MSWSAHFGDRSPLRWIAKFDTPNSGRVLQSFGTFFSPRMKGQIGMRGYKFPIMDRDLESHHWATNTWGMRIPFPIWGRQTFGCALSEDSSPTWCLFSEVETTGHYMLAKMISTNWLVGWLKKSHINPCCEQTELRILNAEQAFLQPKFGLNFPELILWSFLAVAHVSSQDFLKPNVAWRGVPERNKIAVAAEGVTRRMCRFAKGCYIEIRKTPFGFFCCFLLRIVPCVIYIYIYLFIYLSNVYIMLFSLQLLEVSLVGYLHQPM